MTTSVALCTYNGEKFVAEQLDSILNQSIPVNEIVICDDGSTDNTLEILQQYQKNNPNIVRLYCNTQNLGYVKNFEKALTLCSGELIFLSDQDDIWKSNKTETVKECAKQNPEKNIFAHRIAILEPNGEILDTSFWDIDSFVPTSNNSDLLKYLLFERNIFPGMSMAITREAKNKYLPLQHPHRLLLHDFELLLKSCNDNAFITIDESLTLYRMHKNQNIGFDKNFRKKQENRQSIYEKITKLNFIKTTVNALNLNKNIIQTYQEKCKADYKNYILNLPFPKNWITHFKMKYYYKILDDIL